MPLTGAALVSLVESAHLQVSCGVELLTEQDVLIEDISADLQPAGSMVERKVGTLLPARCRLRLSRELQWGWQRVRPYISITDMQTGVTDRWNLGVFVLASPSRRAAEVPATFDVDGFDKIHTLNAPYGSSFQLAAGTGVLGAVSSLLTAAGETRVAIDQSAVAVTLPTARVWPLDQGTTRLKVINDLLGLVGYVPLWSDRDGVLRSAPDVPRAQIGPMWAYSADSVQTSTVSVDREVSADLFAAPNRWVFVSDDPAAGTFPAEGAGIYTVTNQSDGPASVDARRRTITQVVRLKAASQAALVVQGDQIVAAAKRVAQQLSMKAGPNPAHWDRDVVTVADAQLGLSGARFEVLSWRFPLDGADMDLELRAVA